MSSSALGNLVGRCLGVFRCHHVHPHAFGKADYQHCDDWRVPRTLPSSLSGPIVLHTKRQYQQDRYVESARRHESPVIEPIGSISRVTSSLSFFEVLALLEMVGHPPLGEPIKLASCVWE